MLSPSGNKLWDFLSGESLEEELAEEAKWVADLQIRRESLAARVEALLPERIAELQRFRARLSNSLRRSIAAVDRWNKGQELLNSWILEDRKLSLSDFQTLNRVLVNCEETPDIGYGVFAWRNVDVFTTQVKHPPPDELNTMMKAFETYLAKALSTKSDFTCAFLCRYWILSIHPFMEGNGRTSQLLADYYLLRSGFPPQSFTSKLEANLIGHPEKKSFMTPHEAFKRFCQTVFNSFFILEDRE